MPAPNLPNTLLKLGLALAKHHIKNVIGDEALEVVADTLADVGGEKVQAKVDSIFASKEGQKELLKAAKSADERFKKKCKDKDLRDLFTMDYGDLPSVQKAIASLPEALDDDALRETLFTAFRNDAPKRINDEKINEGVNLYVECLQSALIPVKDFGLRIIHNALKEIGKDVKDIKADVKALLEKTITGAQDAADSKNYARFLVPFPHNPDFVGRDEELASLHEMLQQKQSIVGIRPTVLVGLGGIGKTQLAVEYAHAHRGDYPSGVFWLNAINPLLFEFSDLAAKLEIADRDTPRDKAARKTWDYLDSHPDTLVIFDNVLEPSELNIPFSPDLVPANLRCRTLFTTRQRDFPRTFQPFEVKVLPEMAAMKLLLRSRPEVMEEHHPEWGWARIVCAYLGWLPLALELAAAYLGAYPEVSITGYLERLRNEGSLETVDESEVHAVDLPTRVEEILKIAAAGNLEVKHQVAVSATLQTQWKRLDDDDARLLFCAAGQFPDASWIPIPRLGLLTGIESGVIPGRPSPLNVALKKLHAVSLIEELTDDRLRLHPLVQKFAARLSLESFRIEMAERVVSEFNNLLRLQARVILHGIDSVIGDLRTALGFCAVQKATKIYSQIAIMERVIDKQAHILRNWKSIEAPILFLQQIRSETFIQGMKSWMHQSESLLTNLNSPYLRECFHVFYDTSELRSLIDTDSSGKVAISTDGKIVLSTSLDGSIKVWDTQTGRQLRTLAGHSSYSSDIALSKDGHLAISSSGDKTLKIWDIATGQELRTLTGHRERINSVTISSDGRIAASGSDDQELKIWEVATGNLLHTFIGHSSKIRRVTMSEDGQFALSVSEDRRAYIWDVDKRLSIDSLLKYGPYISDAVLSTSGRFVICNFFTGSLSILDMETGNEMYKVQNSSSLVSDIALSSDGSLGIYGSWDKTLTLWNIFTGKEIGKLVGHSDFIKDVALSGNGKIAVSVSNDDTIKIWDTDLTLKSTAAGQGNYAIEKHEGEVHCISISADGRKAVSASSDEIKVWDIKSGIVLQSREGIGNHNITLSPNGRYVIFPEYDKLVFWDLKTRQENRLITGGHRELHQISLNKNGRIAIAASDEVIYLWNTTTRQSLGKIRPRNGQIRAIKLSPDGNRITAIFSDKSLRVWDIKTDREAHTILETKSDKSIHNILLSNNGDTLIMQFWNEVYAWKYFDPFNNRINNCVIMSHTDLINGISLSENALTIATVSLDKSIKVWDILSGRCIASLTTNVEMKCCAMSKDGKITIAGDSVGNVHFIELMNSRKHQIKRNDNSIKKSSWLRRLFKR